MIQVFPIIWSSLPVLRPYLHTNILEDTVIIFGIMPSKTPVGKKYIGNWTFENLGLFFFHPEYYVDASQNLIIYLGFYVVFNTVQVISLLAVGRAEETSTYS